MKEKKLVIFTFFKSVILKKLAREEIEHAQINMPLFEDRISSIYIYDWQGLTSLHKNLRRH